MNDIWKSVEGFDYYKVNQKGEVMSVGRDVPHQKSGHLSIKERVLKPKLHNGYHTIAIYKDKKSYMKLVHRLVAQAFIPNPENKEFVNHKDFNRINNKIENLEWVTRQENADHALIGKRIVNGHKHPGAKLLKEERAAIRLLSSVWPQSDLARAFKVTHSTIAKLLKNNYE